MSAAKATVAVAATARRPGPDEGPWSSNTFGVPADAAAGPGGNRAARPYHEGSMPAATPPTPETAPTSGPPGDETGSADRVVAWVRRRRHWLLVAALVVVWALSSGAATAAGSTVSTLWGGGRSFADELGPQNTSTLATLVVLAALGAFLRYRWRRSPAYRARKASEDARRLREWRARVPVDDGSPVRWGPGPSGPPPVPSSVDSGELRAAERAFAAALEEEASSGEPLFRSNQRQVRATKRRVAAQQRLDAARRRAERR